MLYAASSRRSTVHLQRQASLRRRNSTATRPLTKTIRSRPNTAGSFVIDRRPTTPYKKTTSLERIEKIRETFLLIDDELKSLYLAFCMMATKKTGASLSTPPVSSKSNQKRAKAKQKSAHRQKKVAKAQLSKSADKVPGRSWEDEIATSQKTLSISDFFATFQLSHKSNGGFLDGIFDLVGTGDIHAMTFGEFLDGILIFCSFKMEDVIRFVFFMLDKTREGLIPRFQLLRFVESIHGKKFLVFEQGILPADTPKSNDQMLKLPIAERKRNSVDYLGLKRLCTDYPSLLEPILLLQSTIRVRIMGEAWWKRKEGQIEKHFRTLDQAKEKKRRRKEKILLHERKKKIVSDIGWMSYFFKGRLWSEAESGYPKPIVTLADGTGDIRVEWTRTDGKHVEELLPE